MSILERVMAGTIFLVGIYLIVTNPYGTSTLVNSSSNAYNSGVKALQGR